MDTFSPLALIAAHNWQRATFTTYSFSASFTEAVLVEALMRQGVTEITILTDPLGYRMALRERGAVRIGREYLVHPIAVRHGCFHPKLMVLEADDATHVTVGSGNLTFGGWSNNLECIEHLHANGMSLAIEDVGRFFTSLADSDACRHGAQDFCRTLGQRLAVAAARGSDNGAVRVANSLDAAIIDRIAEAADALGGAESLTMASPYWDRNALETLASLLGLQQVMAHVPPNQVPAPKDMDWPRNAPIVRPVEVQHLAANAVSGRGLHAKMTEVCCRRGRLTISGSANATSAAMLYGQTSVRNVEVCVIRTDLGADRRWHCKPAKAPPRPTSLLEDEESEVVNGVLTAMHTENGIRGQILTPWRGDSALVTLEVNRQPIELGAISVIEGKFLLPLDEMDDELSLEGRIQLRLQTGNDVAEGFVTAPDFSFIKRRASGALASMSSVLKNMETPEDVLAVMEYIRANPDTLRTRDVIRSRSADQAAERTDPIVDASLVGLAHRGATDSEPIATPQGKEELAWQKFVARLLQALARTTVQTEDDEDEADRTEMARRRRAAKALDKLELRFPQLFQKLLEGIVSDIELVNLARLTHFVCVTTSHPASGLYLARLISTAGRIELGPLAKDIFSWCIAYRAANGLEFDAATARGRMLVLGIDPARVPEKDCELAGFRDLVAPGADIDAAFAAIRSTRTVYDDVKALEAGLATNIVPDGLRALPYHEAWPRLLVQCEREPEKRRIRFVDRPVKACPKCNIVLLPDLKSELARNGICETNCHGFILVRNAK